MTERDAPIPEELRGAMNTLASELRARLPASHGFALLVFPYYSRGDMSYISSANRRDMMHALRELLAKWEADVKHSGD